MNNREIATKLLDGNLAIADLHGYLNSLNRGAPGCFINEQMGIELLNFMLNRYGEVEKQASELAAFKRVLFRAGDEPENMTPQRAAELIKSTSDTLALIQKQTEEIRRSLVECNSMLSLLRHRCERSIPWGTPGIPTQFEIDRILGKADRVSKQEK